MGLLTVGTPLPWEESRPHIEHVKRNGVEQLLYVLRAAYERNGDPLVWGDEIEYMLYQFRKAQKDVVLSVQHDGVIEELEEDYAATCAECNVSFHPEYGRYMVEATPRRPYSGLVVTEVERNMAARRHLLGMALAQTGVVPLSTTVFARMGCADFVDLPEPWSHKNAVSRSLYLPDEIINRHTRFPTLTTNIRVRRGEKVCMNVPMFKDENTPERDDTVYERDWFPREDRESLPASRPGHIYMDSMGFGMGCSCLQLTFSAPNVTMARYIYDTMVTLSPIMLALSAASPFFKGWLAEYDVRWNVIAGAVDDRTPYERNAEPLLPDGSPYGGIAPEKIPETQRIIKSRYSSVDLYLGGNKFFMPELNDVPVAINNSVYTRLLDNEIFPVDENLARHFAHLFVRDPLVIFNESLDQHNDSDMGHFENIQSTNWQTVRFKPPTQDATPGNMSVPGWRVEFRPMEIQLHDFENAAFANFVYLLVECMVEFKEDINAYVPMSLVWENMDIAHQRDSVNRRLFYWKNGFSADADYDTELYTMDEIFHNKENGLFPQFIDRILRRKGYVKKHWNELINTSGDQPDRRRLYYYLKLVSDRAKGELPTSASYLRHLVVTHPEYARDSRISKRIAHDLMQSSLRITNLDNSADDIIRYFGLEIGSYLLENGL
ncbi:AaceriAFR086Cp [[Ashbya] aceris (nom. inval.)]|nr:AaceriAFR086Cp [[Ashbya] aceris (nom. inval.)]